MLKGMEDYLFRYASVINFGDDKTIKENLRLAILANDSFNHKIFQCNLREKIEENKTQQANRQKKQDSDRDSLQQVQ